MNQRTTIIIHHKVITQEEVSIETFLDKHLAEAHTFKDDKECCLDLFRWDVNNPNSIVRVAKIDLSRKEWEELDGVMGYEHSKLVAFAKANKDRIQVL